jgi:hypothetical protein
MAPRARRAARRATRSPRPPSRPRRRRQGRAASRRRARRRCARSARFARPASVTRGLPGPPQGRAVCQARLSDARSCATTGAERAGARAAGGARAGGLGHGAQGSLWREVAPGAHAALDVQRLHVRRRARLHVRRRARGPAQCHARIATEELRPRRCAPPSAARALLQPCASLRCTSLADFVAYKGQAVRLECIYKCNV